MKRLLLTFFFVSLLQYVQAQCLVTAFGGTTTCGLCNGFAVLSFSGGTPPYLVNFNGQNFGSSTGAPLTIPNLCPGFYSFSVTDVNAVLCTGTVSVTVTPWGSPLVNSFTITNPSCPTCNDGLISATVTGGIPPYFYSWNNGGTASAIGNLGAGIYVLTTIDSMGCTDTDTVFLSYNSSNLYTISGKVFYDVDNDGNFGGPDIPLAQQQIQQTPAGQITYSDHNGNYIFGDTSGTFSVSYQPVTGYSISNGVPSHTVTITTSNVSGQDFAVQPDSMFHGLNVYSYSPLPRCSTNASFQTIITNTGTYIDSGSVSFNFDPQMVFTGSSSGGTVNGQTLTFTFDSLLPFETRVLYSNFIVPGPGTVIYTSTNGACFDATGSILSADSSSYAQSILCAYDPNDKQVLPEGDGPAHRVDMDTELRYLIRFQNTGNDTAFNVLVIDTLDAGLDPNSAYVISTSHPCWIQKVNGHIMRFNFDNILLPDSNTNEPESNGYILFTVKGSTQNPDPTVVNNTAYIYFDQNAPVSTNSTLTTFSNNTTGLISAAGRSKGGVKFTPHPLHSSTVISFEGEAQHSHSLEISDLRGRTIGVTQKFFGNSTVLQREKMPDGIYMVRITDEITKEVYYSRMLVN